METFIFTKFFLAIIIGALIGVERSVPKEGEDPKHSSSEIGGIRSYSLIAFLGALTTWLDITHGGGDTWKFIGLGITGIFILASYIYIAFRHDKIGIASEYAGFLAYIFGAMIMMEYITLTIILAVLSLVLLSSKDYLARLREKISHTELNNSIKFAVIALIILPLLPDYKYSIIELLSRIGMHLPFTHDILTMHFFNPHSVWFFVVIMAGVEYVGYILSKTLGRRGGAILSGAVGGLISSTAVTGAMTSKSKDKSGNEYSYATATLIASMIMGIRVIIISSFYNPKILGTILIPSLAMLIALGGSAYYFFRKSQQNPAKKVVIDDDHYDSPFQIIPAIEFAMIIVAVKFIAGIGLIYSDVINPQIFYYILGIISGLADVDAITMDMAGKSIEGSLPLVIAATTILISVMSNNIVKASISFRLGEKTFGRSVAIGFGISILCGIAAIIIMHLGNLIL